MEFLDGEDGDKQGNEESAEARAFRRRLAKHDKWQMERISGKMFSSGTEKVGDDYANEILFPLAKECVS